MQGSAGAPNPMIGYIITAVVLIVVLAIRLRRINQSRPLKVERLWIVPAVYGVLTATVLLTAPPARAGWALCAVAFLLGGALGWQRGRLMKIEVDPETHAVTTRQSPAAFLFIIVLIALKSGMRTMVPVGSGGGIFHLSPATLTDILVAFALGLLGIQRLEMYLRARRLLEEARRA
ncbi:MAG TPA: CcdC protein domain-containing protein [Allosphingosinicella sp.]|jgi:hypothetical protein